jgi:hypothetical protein
MTTKEDYNLTIETLEKMGKDVHYTATSIEQRAMLSVLEELYTGRVHVEERISDILSNGVIENLQVFTL